MSYIIEREGMIIFVMFAVHVFSRFFLQEIDFVRLFVFILTRNNGTEPRAPNRGQALQHSAQARARVAQDKSHTPVLCTGRKHLAITSAGKGEGSWRDER